jgi:hypothetical protein
MVSFGVAIPTYINHGHLMQSLLENIAGSTVKPDMISVSCSSVSVDQTTELVVDSVPVVLQYTSAVLNPSQNRNKAASLLKTDLISFIDGDDLAHPLRNEYVRDAFLENPSVDAVYHGYTCVHPSHRSSPFEPLSPPDLVLGQTVPNSIGMGILVGSNHIHHAHCTVRKSVFDSFKFDEHPMFKYSEDSVYAHTLASHGVNIGYLANPLSRYIK